MSPVEAFDAQESGGWVVPAGDDDSEQPAPGSQVDSDAVRYARGLVEGVQAHQTEIDSLIESYADRWALQRMPVVDLSVLRIALFELLWDNDVPVAVAINEAVELAKSLSTDDSGRFINGLLGRIVDEERPKGVTT
jgi:transcription antitermination factor NusB